MLGLMTVTEMQNVQRFLSAELTLGTDTSKQLEMSAASLKETDDIVSSPAKTYASISAKITKQLQSLHASLSLIGQLTQLRRSICCHLTSISKFDSKLLHSCLQSFQQSILNRSSLVRLMFLLMTFSIPSVVSRRILSSRGPV